MLAGKAQTSPEREKEGAAAFRHNPTVKTVATQSGMYTQILGPENIF
jgi:hypothetical protein